MIRLIRWLIDLLDASEIDRLRKSSVEPWPYPPPPPPRYDPDIIRWIEDHNHGPSRPRTWRCWFRCPHKEAE